MKNRVMLPLVMLSLLAGCGEARDDSEYEREQAEARQEPGTDIDHKIMDEVVGEPDERVEP